MQQDLKVSVCMITYGHQKYIREAIEGVLMQQCNFEVELILANDCSPDQTDEIIQDILLNHPKASWIKYFKHENNLGMMPNFVYALKKCSGNYVALCEGDDYWTDPLKLQKQVNFLEGDPDYTICYHKVKILRNDILEEDFIPQNATDTTTLKDLAKGNYIHTCSVVYRNNLFDNLPKYFQKSPIGDYFLHMLNARYGQIKFLDEYMGVYRIHEISVWSSKTQAKREKIWIGFLKNIRRNFDKEVKGLIDNQIKRYNVIQKRRTITSIKNNIKRLIFFKSK